MYGYDQLCLKWPVLIASDLEQEGYFTELRWKYCEHQAHLS